MKKSISKSGLIYITESFRVGSKTSSRIVEKLGKISDIMAEKGWTEEQVLDWVDQRVAQLNKQKKAESPNITLRLNSALDLPMGQVNSHSAGYLFLQSIYSSLGIPKIMNDLSDKYRIQYSLDDILSCMVFNRILHPCSKLQTWKERTSFLENWNFSKDDVYRSLEVLGTNMDSIQENLFVNSDKAINRNTDILFYDCTNFYFEVEQADTDGMRHYGKSKENRPNPIVQMGLFMDKDGIPVRFSLFPGNQSEQLSVNKDVIRALHKKYQIGRFVYCADAGLNSSKIKEALDSITCPCSYVVTQSIKKLDADLKEWALDEGEKPEVWHYTKFDEERNTFVEYSILFEDIDKSPTNKTIYYRERWTITKSGREERLIVTYSPKYADYLAKLRSEHLLRALKKLNSQGDRKRQTDPKRFIKATHMTKDGEEAKKTTYQIDEDKLAEESRYDGFYCVSTDLEDDINEILRINKQRWMIEDGFRTMKTNFDARPVYCRKEESIKAHFLICYIALLIMSILRKITGPDFTQEELIETLRKMNLAKVSGNPVYIPTFSRTPLTDRLSELFNLPLGKVCLTDKKLEQLIKRTHKKRKLPLIANQE